MIPIELIDGLLKSKYTVKPSETVPDQVWFTRREVKEIIKTLEGLDYYLTLQDNAINSTTKES
mgnify:CR=1 FL=1